MYVFDTKSINDVFLQGDFGRESSQAEETARVSEVNECLLLVTLLQWRAYIQLLHRVIYTIFVWEYTVQLRRIVTFL